jgi:heme a synthase
MEWGHRLLGRLTGLAFVIPLVVFVLRQSISRHRLPAFAAIGVLFALQGLLGWLMVMSGLVDQPRVSHLRLTLHLTAALALLGACLWLAFGYAFGQPNPTQPRVSPRLKGLSVAFLAMAVVQIMGGGLVAGLRAGLVSDTFPRMLGEWFPTGLWRLSPVWINHLDNPLMVHFQHRWLAFTVVLCAGALVRHAAHELVPSYLRAAAKAALHLTLLQVVLGMGVVVLHVPAYLASIHQLIAIGILSAALLTCHRALRA